jgi:anti-anti-sigma factor
MTHSSTVSLHPATRFDFNSFRDFRKDYDAALENPSVRLLIVDMKNVQYIDSAALGILLLLRDHAISANKTVEIHNLHGIAKDVLEIANFQKIFTIR